MYKWKQRLQDIQNKCSELLPPEEQQEFLKAIANSATQHTKTSYGQAMGDIGSTESFLQHKFKGIHRINPIAWDVLAPNTPAQQNARGITLQFTQQFKG